MAEQFQPVRLVSKDGEVKVVVTRPQAYNDLVFGQGYRESDDQTNLEPSGPRLVNGNYVDEEGNRLTRDEVDSFYAEAVKKDEDAKLDAAVADAKVESTPPSTGAPKLASKPATAPKSDAPASDATK
jgi:hypothetical protein